MTASAHIRKLGCRASDTAELTFENVRVPDARRVGAVDHAFADTMRILDRGRISIAAMALGLGYGALGKAAGHAKERHPLGSPTSAFSALPVPLVQSQSAF